MNYQPGNIGNMLPHNVQAEEAVLGSVLIDPAVLKDLRWMIDKDDFFLVKHQYIWQCMLEMHDRAASIDFLTLYTTGFLITEVYETQALNDRMMCSLIVDR